VDKVTDPKMQAIREHGIQATAVTTPAGQHFIYLFTPNQRNQLLRHIGRQTLVFGSGMRFCDAVQIAAIIRDLPQIQKDSFSQGSMDVNSQQKQR